jgi:hypothetical protein
VGLKASFLKDQAASTQNRSTCQVEYQEDTHVEHLDHAVDSKQSSHHRIELGNHL